MRFILLLLLLVSGFTGASAQPPANASMTMEHAIYLRARANALRKLVDERLIEYLAAAKLGTRTFDDLSSQIAASNLEIAKLQKFESVAAEDPRIKRLTDTVQILSGQLLQEARRVRAGLLLEGQIAEETIITLTPPQR